MKPESARSSGQLATVLFALPVLYLLSYGPYVFLANRGWLGPLDGPVVRTLWWLYSPVVLLTEMIPGSREVISWYVRLWI